MSRTIGTYSTEQREAWIGPLKALSGLASWGMACPAGWGRKANQKENLEDLEVIWGGYGSWKTRADPQHAPLASFLGGVTNKKEAEPAARVPARGQ